MRLQSSESLWTFVTGVQRFKRRKNYCSIFMSNNMKWEKRNRKEKIKFFVVCVGKNENCLRASEQEPKKKRIENHSQTKKINCCDLICFQTTTKKEKNKTKNNKYTNRQIFPVELIWVNYSRSSQSKQNCSIFACDQFTKLADILRVCLILLFFLLFIHFFCSCYWWNSEFITSQQYKR